jgi:hypothetical protein
MKKEKVEKKFFHGKKDGEKVLGYTFPRWLFILRRLYLP